MVLSIMGNDVHTAYDGEEGVEVACEFRPEVIVFDIGLPKLSGYDACRRVRGDPAGLGGMSTGVAPIWQRFRVPCSKHSWEGTALMRRHFSARPISPAFRSKPLPTS
jgi:hypothetical protein